jgi:hypothetical protein
MDANTPSLATQLRSLKAEARRSILIRACLYSASSLGELDAEFQSLLRTLETSGRLSPEEVSRAAELADAAKMRSFALEEEDAPRAEWLKPLSEACILRGMVNAFGPDCEDDAAAVYDILDSQDHGSKLARFIESEISVALAE